MCRRGTASLRLRCVRISYFELRHAVHSCVGLRGEVRPDSTLDLSTLSSVELSTRTRDTRGRAYRDAMVAWSVSLLYGTCLFRVCAAAPSRLSLRDTSATERVRLRHKRDNRENSTTNFLSLSLSFTSVSSSAHMPRIAVVACHPQSAAARARSHPHKRSVRLTSNALVPPPPPRTTVPLLAPHAPTLTL